MSAQQSTSQAGLNQASLSLNLPERLNIAERFLTSRLAEHGDKVAILYRDQALTYRRVNQMADAFGRLLAELRVEVENRVLIALPDIPEFPAALFGALKLGAVGVMLNKDLSHEEIEYFYQYTRAKVLVVHRQQLPQFLSVAQGLKGQPCHLQKIVVVGSLNDFPGGETAQAELAWDEQWCVEFDEARYAAEPPLPVYQTHLDDAAIWLFSGGTTGRPKAVIQTHRSFANTTEWYAKRCLGMRESDITLSVPKLYFGYATGSNLLFPFSVAATCILFPERCTAERLFELISRHRPTVLINVPTMVSKMLASPEASAADLSSLRFATSAGEALPVELYQRWKAKFGVELLDGLGTAEMWHVFLTNRLGDVKPGTLGRVIEGFELKVCDDQGVELPRGETGWLWVRGDSRAIAYHQQHEKSLEAFRGAWYVSGDMISMDDEGYVTYAGRGDDMLKVGGKWLSPSQVENCLLEHPLVKECAVVGVLDEQGLVKPHAFVILSEENAQAAATLADYVRERLEPYKAPRQIHLVSDLPRTHLGKIDRGRLRAG